jgi:hypothetical protein
VTLLLEKYFSKNVINFTDIPIIINNKNRYTYLLKLINYLEDRGYCNIYIIDNNSTYPPLLEYYRITKHKVFNLKRNYGYLALWKSLIFLNFIRSYYVYTDSDVLPIEDCPNDFLSYFLNILKNDISIKKIGFSLKYDDLPDSYNLKSKVIEWESKFYTKPISDFLFDSVIDTTFALYRPFSGGGAKLNNKTYRTGYPYQAYHLPWYENSNNLNEEQIYYYKNSNYKTFWKIK